MKRELRVLFPLIFVILLMFLVGCSSGAMDRPPVTTETETDPGLADLPSTQFPIPLPTEPPPTQLPGPYPTSTPPGTEGPLLPTPTAFVEERFIELEWPPDMRLGDSDIVRLSLIPSEDGYTPQLEFDEHELDLDVAKIPYQVGFEAFAIARMNAVGLDFSPRGDQQQRLLEGQVLNWRWSIAPENAGRHRLSLQLRIRWEPLGEGNTEEVNIWDSGIEVQVTAPLGIGAPQARMLGVVGLLVGGAMALPLAEFATRRRLERARASKVRRLKPNLDLELDVAPGAYVSNEEKILLQALYHRYDRVTVETRYSSGYSGARTLLVQPSRKDGRTDAYAIVKIGSAREIQSEYSNYESFVRHTLPPITGRVQGPPVLVSGEPDAALEYTFVGMPGVIPKSLKDFVLNSEVGESKLLIEKGLFNTFGTGWWLQRVPYTFRSGIEYDRLLPVHVVLEAATEKRTRRTLTGKLSELDGLVPGDLVRLEGSFVAEVRPRRNTATLSWSNIGLTPAVRVRFQNTPPEAFIERARVRNAYGRVVFTRESLLQNEVTKAFPDLNLTGPKLNIWNRMVDNPLPHLKEILEKRVRGTQSIIHGDLNLENVLVGPGDLVWLIDFASTREGHTLFDFARLEAELTTQVVSEIFVRSDYGPERMFTLFDALEFGRAPEDQALHQAYGLLDATRQMARRLLFDNENEDEFIISLYLAYLGTLKFSNLDELPFAPMPKALAFGAAAYLITKYLHSK